MSSQKLVILGCGSSSGVPTLTNYWGECDPSNPKNYRTRSSLYIEADTIKILIDTSPDLRVQMLKNNITDIDAVLYTHAHADHIHGIDELRELFFQRNQKIIPIYGSQELIEHLKRQFSYLFREGPLSIYPHVLKPNIIKGRFRVEHIDIIPFTQAHGDAGVSTGFRIGGLAYSTDFNKLEDEALESLKNLDIWIVDCLSIDSRPTHLNLAQAIQWIEKVKPKKAILTHMNVTLDYDTLVNSLPSHIIPAYDGLTLYF
jgi:phosphoribosyl 1,2-cyclic phosphate phosphodiesterase